MTESFEFENVRIGNWQGRLPSQICTERDIFNEIFSLETWDKVLMPDQKERILKMLPLEVLSTPGAADQTMEDLLAKTLTRFDFNPLENLFNQLEVGQLDPDVVVTKAAIRKEWRKESLRKRKKYHTKLLEEIVVSREKHLKAFESSSNNFLFSGKTKLENKLHPNKLERLDNHFSANLEHDGVFLNDVKTPSMYNNNSISDIKNDSEETNHIMKRVNKRVKEELSTINRQTGCISSSEDESPVIKKPTRSKATTKTSKPSTTSKQRATKSQTISKALKSSAVSNPISSSSSVTSCGKSVAVNVKLIPSSSSSTSQSLAKHLTSVATTAQSMSALSTIPSPSVSSTSRTSTKDQTAAKLAKFPKILPAPATSTSILSSPVTNSSSITTQNHLPVKPSHVQIQTALNSPSSVQLSNPVKSSPILASQLQAPAMSMSSYSPHNSISKLPNSVRKFSSPMINFSPHNKLSDKSSEDDLESSSDEFESFESLNPSIVFSTNNFSSVPKKSVTKTKGGIVGSSPRQTSKVAPLKPKVGIVATTFSSGKAMTATVASATITTSKIQPGNIKALQPHQQLVSVKVGGNNTIVTKNALPVGKSTNTHVNLNANTLPTIPSNLLSPILNSSVSPQNILPLSVGMQNSPTQLQQTKILFTTNPSTLCNANSFSPVAGNGIHSNLNSLPSISVSNSQLSPISNSTLSSISLNLLSATDLHHNSTMHQNIHDQQVDHGHNSNVLVDTDDLNLNNLSLGLEMGISMNLSSLDGDVDCLDDVDGDNSKLVMENMDKMDDLSVLDGNPFDSIPNLSDELDGLDLDMVDGLCDFDGLLSEEKQYTSFFSLIREVLCSTRDHRMTLICLEKTIRKWASSPSAALNPWFMKVNDWNEALITALNFLAGNYQGSFNVHPEEFVPYIEYKYKTKYYQWIGAGRDGDNNLTPLCTLWMDNLERLPPLKKLEGENEDPDDDDDEDNDSDGPNEDAKKKNKRPLTPPPPRCVTDWAVRPSTQEEKENFQIQERNRFDNPHKAFTYRMHGYESVVGPVKGVYSSQSGMTNKARGHSLLVDDRPPYVTILALVRDAVARLPNGEGTRSEICEMLRDSAFLAAEASNVTLNSVVSGALDRLHYERDPCVRYDSHKKSWIYLHRDRTQEQFERLHHNRSYTKSTKSRNNTSRKSRKAAAKSPAQLSNSPNDSSGAISTSAAVTTASKSSSALGISNPTAASTPISAARNQNISGITMSGALVSTQGIGTDTSNKNNTLTIAAGHLQGGTSSAQDGTTQFPIKIHNKNVGEIPKHFVNDVLAAAASLAPTIRFTIPGASSATALGGPFTNSNNSSDQQHLILHNPHNQNSGAVSNVGGNISITTQNQVPIQIQSQAPHQVQNLNNTRIPSSSTVTLNSTGGSNLLTVTSAASTTTSSSYTSGQFVFGPQALLRLAGSLRLPEGIRFTSLRMPGTVTGALGTTPLRLPQHRILLTRGSLPGSTQGVLFQTVTSTGQTVLLSTTPGSLGNLQGTSTQLTPISIQSNPSSVDTVSNNLQHAQAAQNVNIMNSNPQNVNVVTTTSLNSLSGSTVTVSQGGVNTTQLTSLDSGTSVGGAATISIPASLLGANTNTIGNHQSLLNHGNASNQTLMTSTGTPMQTLTVAQQTQNMVSQVQAQLQQQNTGGPQTAQLTSPIIIRSNQGDFVIPGHISLGRGMQGIKVIPMPTGGGKQTVIARIVAPNTNASNPVNPTSNTQS